MIDKIVKDIESSLKNENFLAALALALTLPDICGKAEFPNEKSTSKRYKQWYDEYVGQYEKPPVMHQSPGSTRVLNDDMPYMSGEINRMQFWIPKNRLNEIDVFVGKEMGKWYSISSESLYLDCKYRYGFKENKLAFPNLDLAMKFIEETIR